MTRCRVIANKSRLCLWYLRRLGKKNKKPYLRWSSFRLMTIYFTRMKDKCAMKNKNIHANMYKFSISIIFSYYYVSMFLINLCSVACAWHGPKQAKKWHVVVVVVVVDVDLDDVDEEDDDDDDDDAQTPRRRHRCRDKERVRRRRRRRRLLLLRRGRQRLLLRLHDYYYHHHFTTTTATTATSVLCRIG